MEKSKLNVDEYLKRLNCESFREVSLENLKKLQKSHLRTFAYENLDLHIGKFLNINLTEAYEKIMYKSRGGWCYELNPLFAWLLESLGYECFFVPADTYQPDIRGYRKHPYHIIIIVILNDEKYYVDVGTSKFLNEPVKIVLEEPQIFDFTVFKFKMNENDPDEFLLERCPKKIYLNTHDTVWLPHMKFKLIPRKLKYFEKYNYLAQQKRYTGLPHKSICTRQDEGIQFILVGFKYSEIVYKDNEEIRTDKNVTYDEIKKLLPEKFKIIVNEPFEPKDEPFDPIDD